MARMQYTIAFFKGEIILILKYCAIRDCIISEKYIRFFKQLIFLLLFFFLVICLSRFITNLKATLILHVSKF